MYFREFTLTQGDVLNVKKALNRIRLLYPQICIRFEKTDSESKSKILWITVNGPTEQICEDAKKYMIAMTKNDTKDTILIPEAVQKELLLNNCKILRDIETQNTVVIDLDVIKHHVSIQGDELEVTLAKSLIYEQIEKFQKLSRNGNVDYLADRMKEVTIDNNIKNFALKLGYNESTIKLAANNCIENGIELNEDTLLKELTKQCPQNIPNNNSSNPEIQEEDFVAKTVAQYTSEQLTMDNNDLRGIVIDGSNVAMCHGHKQIFSCAGIEIVVNWFKQRGHRNIKVFVPQWRQEAPKADCPIKNQEILGKLEKEKILVFTPSRRINGRRIVCYDDRYIVKYAVETDSIIVSNDNFRDLQKENPKWKQYLDLHILMYSFVNDMFMPPDDPLGRSGPNLDEFLKAGPYQAKICPYRNKCTYGSKCRYFHPESNIDTNDKGSNYSRSTMNSEHEPVSRYSSINNRSCVLAQPFPMSCAAEMKAYEHQQQYQLYENDVIARGGAVMSDDFSTNSDQHRSMREWQQRQPQPQAYPSMNYYQAQPYQQYHAQRQTSIQPQSQQFYTLPASTQPTQWTTSPQPSHYQPQPQPQSYTLQPRSTPPPSNQYYMPVHHTNNNSYHHPNAHLSLMNGGYVDPRSMNNGYYQQPVTSHTLQVIEPRKREMVERATFERRSQIEGSPLFQNLIELFPDYSAIVRKVLTEHPNERDMNILVSHVLNEQNR